MTNLDTTPNVPQTKLAIIGLGLMGGSLGMAARACGMQVAAYARREESLREALAMGVADSVFDSPEAAVEGADIVVLCTPVLSMPELVRGMANNLKDGCIVTDVGSTKDFLADKVGAELAGTSAQFIGSHPMVGSEKTGLEATKEDLYEKALVIVTPVEGVDIDKVKCIVGFWEKVGANVIEMTPKAHDKIISRTSHLPHLVAASLMACVDREEQDLRQFCGTGVRDVTRVAEGSEFVWHDIVKSNSDAILAELNVFGETVDELKSMLERKDFDAVREFLATSREKRAKLG